MFDGWAPFKFKISGKSCVPSLWVRMFSCLFACTMIIILELPKEEYTFDFHGMLWIEHYCSKNLARPKIAHHIFRSICDNVKLKKLKKSKKKEKQSVYKRKKEEKKEQKKRKKKKKVKKKEIKE